MNFRHRASLLVIASYTLWLTACGGGGSTPPTPPPAISVALNPAPPTSLVTSATASITAVVSNDSKNGGVTWSVTCAASPCGSFNPATTASGSATTYTAPAAPTTVSITATSVSDTTKSTTASVTIVVPAIAVALTPTPPTSLAASATASITAVVTNDSQNKGVTWSVTCGSSGACGSFNPTSTTSGSATTYTAPAAIPTSNTVTVTATSVTDTTKSATATITIGAPSAILADGTYVYHFSGWVSTGPSFIAGAFTVKSGVITSGEQDFSDVQSGYTDPLVASGSSLTVAGKNIQIVLATANTAIGVNGVETLRGTLVSSTRVLISEFDAFGTGTGSIDLQTSAAAPSGGYAFAISGFDLSNPPSPLAIGGVLNISGTSLNVANSVFDFNLNGGLIGQAKTFASGTLTAPDSFGRVTFNLTPSAASGVPQFVLTGYIVGTNQIQLVESQADTLDDDLGGMALGQGTNTGQFTAASIASKTYVYGASGQDVNNLVTIGGSFTFNSSGAVAGNLAINDGAVFGTNPISGGSFTVDPTGRVTLTGVNVPAISGTAFTFQLYLDGNGNALELGVDTLQTTAGQAYLQTTTAADFEGSYALLGQGILDATGLPAWGAVGPVTVASDAFTGSTDYTAQNAGASGTATTANQALTGTETNSNAMLALTGLDSTALTTSRSYSYFPIDSKRVLAIEIDGKQLGLLTLETINH